MKRGSPRITVEEMRALRANGKKLREIANIAGASVPYVSLILKGKRNPDVTGSGAAELDAMKACVMALEVLPPRVQTRVLDWLNERFGKGKP